MSQDRNGNVRGIKLVKNNTRVNQSKKALFFKYQWKKPEIEATLAESQNKRQWVRKKKCELQGYKDEARVIKG